MNLLTGNCKELFLKWYKKNYRIDEEDDVSYQYFINEHETCRRALIVDFFEGVGIYISSELSFKKSEKHASEVYKYDFDKILGDCLEFKGRFFGKTKPEAIDKAIEKANELINNR